MKKAHAVHAMEIVQQINSRLCDLGELLREVSPEPQKKLLLTGVGNIILSIYSDIMKPIIDEHPDTNPDS